MKKKGKNNHISLFKWIWHSYLKTSLIPLILVEIVFVGIYFSANNWSQKESTSFLRDEVNKELRQISLQESISIQQKLSGVENATELFRRQMSLALNAPASIDNEDSQRLKYSPEGIYYSDRDKNDGGSAIFYSGIKKIEESELSKVSKVLTLQGLMKDIKESQPLVSSLYLNTFDSLNIIYPYFDVISQYPPLMDIPKYNFYYEADKEHNPEGKVKWTDAYLDPAGHGWMASAIAPIYNNNFLEGVVGLDITIGSITNSILNMEIPWEGYGILVGKDGTILAIPPKGEEDWGLSELKDHHYSDVILKDTFKPDQFNIYKIENLTSFTSQISGNSEGLSNISLNGKHLVVSWATIPDTDWKFLTFVQEKNIYSKVDDMQGELLKIGKMMIAGLLLFYSIFFYILAMKSRKMSSEISHPLFEINSLVQRIGKGDYYQEEPDFFVRELKETAFYLINMGKHLGDTNESLLKTQIKLQKKENDLRTLIKSIDDIIIVIDEHSNLINVWSKNTDALSKIFLEDSNNSLEMILGEEGFKEYDEKLKNIIKTGKTETVEYLLETMKGLRWFQARMSLISSREKTIVVSARDITEQKEMQKSIIASKDIAEKANKAKSQFLSNMSHELRTPLNAILGFSQILQMDPATPLNDSQNDYVNEILKAGNHLLLLINQVLDLSKIESGKMTLDMEMVKIKTIMEDTITLIQPFSDKYGIQLITYPTELDDEFILVDNTRTKQVFLNLLSNAVKYSNESGNILFYCEKFKNNIRFNVIDNGCGISKENLKTIFQPFYRVYDINNNIEGTGIGLSVVKQLVELMGGNVFVESTEGTGSHFWVDIPCENTHQSQ